MRALAGTMTTGRLRKRSRMRRKEVAALAERLADAWAPPEGLFDEEATVDAADFEGRPVYLMEHEAIAFEHEGKAALSVRGLLRWGAGRAKVTVDMGAVRHVTNGADVMTPGVTEADPDIEPGDLVWVADETHGKPLGVGEALVSGRELGAMDQGRGVASLHYLGDKMWDLGHEDAKDNP